MMDGSDHGRGDSYCWSGWVRGNETPQDLWRVRDVMVGDRQRYKENDEGASLGLHGTLSKMYRTLCNDIA